MPTDKPYFVCPIDVMRLPDGTLEFHITRRDGSVLTMPGPPAALFEQLSEATFASQPEGSDEVVFGTRPPPRSIET
jgi:hypothetical protein